MADDLRAHRMPSIEGRGKAKAAWDAYARTVNKVVDPLFGDLIRKGARSLSVSVVEDLVGFWIVWQLYGGFEGLQRIGMARTTIFRKVKRFRQLMGCHPDEYVLPGVTVDVKAYFEQSARRKQEPASTPD